MGTLPALHAETRAKLNTQQVKFRWSLDAPPDLLNVRSNTYPNMPVGQGGGGHHGYQCTS